MRESFRVSGQGFARKVSSWAEVKSLGLQLAAVCLGAGWGYGVARRPQIVPASWQLAAILSLLLVLVEFSRTVARNERKLPGVGISETCVALIAYILFVIYMDPYLWYEGPIRYYAWILFSLPLQLAMSFLIRWRCGIALGCVALFYATTLAITISNAIHLQGGSSFREHWVQ